MSRSIRRRQPHNPPQPAQAYQAMPGSAIMAPRRRSRRSDMRTPIQPVEGSLSVSNPTTWSMSLSRRATCSIAPMYWP